MMKPWFLQGNHILVTTVTIVKIHWLQEFDQASVLGNLSLYNPCMEPSPVISIQNMRLSLCCPVRNPFTKIEPSQPVITSVSLCLKNKACLINRLMLFLRGTGCWSTHKREDTKKGTGIGAKHSKEITAERQKLGSYIKKIRKDMAADAWYIDV